MNCGRSVAKNIKPRSGRQLNEVSKLSAPSPSRMAAQERIRIEKSKHNNPDITIVNELPADSDGMPFIRPPPQQSTQTVVHDEIKKEIKQEIKLEDESRNT